MDDFWQRALLFIDRWSYVFYAVGVLGVLLYLARAREAYRQRKYTPFPIEREEASAMLRDSILILTILLAILATTVYIDRVLLGPTGEATAETPLAAEEPTAEPTSPAIGPSPTVEGETESAAEEAGDEEDEGDAAEEESGDAGESEESAESDAESEGSGDSGEGESEPVSTPTEAAADAQPSPTPVPPTETAAPTDPAPVTPTVEATPIATQPPPPTDTPPPTNTPVPTEPPPPPPTNTPEPALPPVPAANCPAPGVQITSPANGQAVSGVVTIFGTADIDSFQFYKVEYALNGTDGPFASIGDTVASPVTGGALMSWNTASFPPGVRRIRLTVVDETGNFPTPCDIYVIIQ